MAENKIFSCTFQAKRLSVMCKDERQCCRNIPVRGHEADGSQKAHGFQHAGGITRVHGARQDRQRLLVADDLHQPELKHEQCSFSSRETTGAKNFPFFFTALCQNFLPHTFWPETNTNCTLGLCTSSNLFHRTTVQQCCSNSQC